MNVKEVYVDPNEKFSQASCGTLAHCDVFIVDDEITITNLLQRRLSKEGFTVHTSNDPLQALQLLYTLQPAILISDQNMPGLSGVDLLEKAKEIHPDSLRILLTGHGHLEIAQNAINKGEVFRFLSKPWNDEELMNTIHEGLERARLIRENQRLTRITEEQSKKLLEINQSLEAKVLERTLSLENSLRETERLNHIKNDFIANVSHEIRTPLTAIVGYLDLLKEGVYGPVVSKHLEAFNNMEQNAVNLLQMVNDMLDVARIETGKLVIRYEDFSLLELLEEVICSFQLVAHEKGLELSLDRSAWSFSPSIRTDRGMIKQVLSNLISNALRYTTEGQIRVLARRNDKQKTYHLEIHDTGPGIDNKFLPELFERFRTISIPEFQTTTGTGIGLALSKDIIELLEGTIQAKSIVGQGTQISLELPFQPSIKKQQDEDRFHSFFSFLTSERNCI